MAKYCVNVSIVHFLVSYYGLN